MSRTSQPAKRSLSTAAVVGFFVSLSSPHFAEVATFGIPPAAGAAGSLPLLLVPAWWLAGA